MTDTTKYALIAVLLAIAAAVPRFYDLGKLGFYADEETTSFAARSLVESGETQMPSGMPYRRAMLQTLANAGFASLIGADQERSYRLFSALIGTLTVPLIFLAFRSTIGAWPAFLCALLLALSEWHIVVSREARMYGPFLFFYIMAAVASWRWVIHGGWGMLLLAAAAVFLAVSFHTLAIFAAAFVLLPFVLRIPTRANIVHALLFMLLTASLSYWYSRAYEVAPYDAWESAHAISTVSPQVSKDNAGLLNSLPPAFKLFHPFLYITSLLGAVLGGWLAIRTLATNGNLLYYLAWFGLFTGAGALAGLGQIYGAGLLMLLGLLCAPNGLELIKQNLRPLAALALLLVVCCIAVSLQMGVKKTFAFPFAYLYLFAQEFPLVIGVFLLAVVWLAFIPAKQGFDYAKLAVLAALMPIIAIGTIREWGGLRYLMGFYPFMLLVAAFGVSNLAKKLPLGGSTNLKQSMAGILLCVGVLGSHGVYQATNAATLDYGDRIPIFGWPYPDHKTAGEYVRSQLRESDLVIAEDTIEQRWYVGRVDYWLRNHTNHGWSLYEIAEGEYRDIYVDSTIVTPQILQQLKTTKDRRIWLITSAETSATLEHYLSKEQIDWLNGIKATHQPAYTGKDNITEVYLLEPSR